MTDGAARRAADVAARASYGRLVALLAVRSRNIAVAEDALSQAFAAALRVWPERGVPDNPEAWLLTAARRALGHDARARKVREEAAGLVEMAYGDLAAREPAEAGAFPDERLKLLFVCAHPAIDPAIRTPLMLQTVLGLDAERIGAAFLVPAKTMGQRLVRAKAKIRDSGLSFQVPEAPAWPERLGDVLAAVYAAYGTGWNDGGVGGAADLSAEGLWLGRMVVSLVPEDPEAKGLLALMLYCEARRLARRDAERAYVPLGDQDPALWDLEAIIEAENLLTAAARAGRFGRFQIEAAIQSVHCHRRRTGVTRWPEIVRLYDALLGVTDALGAHVGRAAALLEAGNPAAALSALDALPAERTPRYQPYWAARAAILDRLGQDGREARAQALALTHDPGVRQFLTEAGTGGGPVD